MREFDQALGDVPEQIEHLPRYSCPEKFCFIDEFQDDNDSDQHTGFSKKSLRRRLLDLFALPPVILVPRGDGYFYRFGRKRLLIYSLIKMTSGTPSSRLEDGVTGGKSATKMDCGYK